MKKNLLVTIFLIVSGFSMYAQSILNASEGYVTETILSDYSNLSVFDVNGFNLYASDGSKIYHFDLATNELLDTYVLPDYMTGTYTYPSFLKISPDIEALWYGITSGPNGDEIFSYNIETGTWSEGYSLLCNFDMEFIGEHILVSGLNSTSWSDPNCISLLDVSGNDNHRKIIDVGGYSAGLGIDDEGNVYYATSGVGSEKLYRWDMETVINVINDSSAEILTLDDATILSSIPAGAYDTDVDEAGNVFFDFSDYATGVKNVVIWRLPTFEEINELVDCCVCEWMADGLIHGINVVGPNGNSIFFPAAGYRNTTFLKYPNEYGAYWTSTSGSDRYGAHALAFDEDGTRAGWGNGRYIGRTIRPVLN